MSTDGILRIGVVGAGHFGRFHALKEVVSRRFAEVGGVAAKVVDATRNSLLDACDISVFGLPELAS